MLQIASGMYFRPVPLHETVHRTILYTNAHRLEHDAVELPIARLLFSTSLTHVSSVTVEVVDRLESERPDGQPEIMIATGGRELVADIATVLAFALNVTCSTDVDLVRRLVPENLSERPGAAPSSILRRTFDPRVLLTAGDLASAHDFCTRLLALRRGEFEAAVRAIRRVVDATVLIADDPSLAYTLFVAALESLAKATPALPTTWDAFDGRKRKLFDTACGGLTDEQTVRVRAAALKADQSLARKFQAFTLGHIAPSYYRAEAASATRPISATALPDALAFAYNMRSRNVHALDQLAPEVWVMSDRADTIQFLGRTLLSLEGLNRLCRHVIRQFVYRAPTDLDTNFNYRTALPGIVWMPVAPQHWAGNADGLSAGSGPAYLDGFLGLLLPVLRGDNGATLIDMTGVLERIEGILPARRSRRRGCHSSRSTPCGIACSRPNTTDHGRAPSSHGSAMTYRRRAPLPSPLPSSPATTSCGRRSSSHRSPLTELPSCAAAAGSRCPSGSALRWSCAWRIGTGRTVGPTTQCKPSRAPSRRSPETSY